MPRQSNSDAHRKPRASRTTQTARSRRTREEVERALLRSAASDDERLTTALKRVDPHTGAEVVSHLAQRLGNTTMHRVLSHAAAVAEWPVLISFGGRADPARFDDGLRAILTAILRAARLQAATVTCVVERRGSTIFEVAPSSVADGAAFAAAAEAEVGKRVASFQTPSRYAAYHFVIAR